MNVTSYHLLISDARLVDDDVYQCQVGATDSTAGMRSRTAHLTVQSNHLNKRTCCSDVILNYSEKLATTVAMACKLIQKSCYAGAPARFQARVGKIRREAPKNFFRLPTLVFSLPTLPYVSVAHPAAAHRTEADLREKASLATNQECPLPSLRLT